MNGLCHRWSFALLKHYPIRQRYFALFTYSLPVCSVLSNGQCARRWNSYTAKAKNYYDVLELTPKATDSQIKSAYYRLSKKYHPDKNPSKESKAMFAQIAEAYETLGNKRLRKIYDSNRIESPVQRSHTMSNSSPFPQYRSKTKPPTGRSPIYNFDEFYRQHYGDIRVGQRLRKEAYEKAVRERRELVEQKNAMVIFILTSTLIVLFVNLVYMYRSP